MIIEPMRGTVLVELGTSEWGDIPVPEKSHDSLTWGKVVAVNEDDKEAYGFLQNRNAHWRKYKDDARVDNNYAFIEIKDILGTSYANTTSTR
jgi:co-chaperonin GroES (HSP10)